MAFRVMVDHIVDHNVVISCLILTIGFMAIPHFHAYHRILFCHTKFSEYSYLAYLFAVESLSFAF
jgi:hypothetical protein